MEHRRSVLCGSGPFVGLVACATLIAGCIPSHSSESAPARPAPEVRSEPRARDRQVKATGVIKARVGAEVRVGARISGVVDRLYVKVGDAVAKGDVLATLDDRDLVARRAGAEADLRRTEAELRYAEAEFRRNSELRAARVVAPSELDLAERGCAVARQQVEVARAALEFASIQLEYARITAPISGVVASVATQEGETVAASFAAPTFVTLIDLTRLEVWAYVDETDIGRIEPGLAARFTVDTYGEEEFPGTVATIYPKAEIRDNVVNYVTVVRFDPVAGRTLRPEMTTTVRIALGPDSAADPVPASSAPGRAAAHEPGSAKNITGGRGDELRLADRAATQRTHTP